MRTPERELWRYLTIWLVTGYVLVAGIFFTWGCEKGARDVIENPAALASAQSKGGSTDYVFQRYKLERGEFFPGTLKNK